MKKTPSLFAPNVLKGGVGGHRYVLYKRGPGLFSVTPLGQRFRASFEADDCGLGCRCGAFLTGISEAGIELLNLAERIDNMNNTVTRQ